MLQAVLLCTLAAVSADAAKADPPAKKELFAAEDFYKEQKGKEQDFTGTLRYKPLGDGVAIIGRYNPFTLEVTVKGKKETREVYVGGKDALLKDYAGKKVKITGKPVEIEVVGKVHREIWPARVALVAEEPGARTEPAGDVRKVKVVARTPGWSQLAARKRGPFAAVIRDARELAVSMGKGAGDEKEALQQAADLFKVKEIDFKNQAVVVISGGTQRSGGYSVEVTDVVAGGGKTTVKWKLNTPKPGAFVTLALTNPGTAVLIEKPAGKVVFDPAPKAAPGAKE